MSEAISNSLSSRLRTAIDKSVSNPVMFFFTSGAAWLAVAVFLGLFTSIKSINPAFCECFGALSTGRAYVAHINVLIYGWCFQAAFGAIVWFMARLCRKEATHSGIVLFAGHLWNFGVTIGLLGILLGGGTGVPWMEFPVATWPIFLVCYILITIWSFIQFRVREGGHVYISQWYLLSAIFLFPWIYLTANLFVFGFEGHAVMTAGIASWFKSALTLLFFIPIAIASAYYITSHGYWSMGGNAKTDGCTNSSCSYIYWCGSNRSLLYSSDHGWIEYPHDPEIKWARGLKKSFSSLYRYQYYRTSLYGSDWNAS